MIKVLYGEKGTGKTKALIEAANNLAAEGSGDVVFIDCQNRSMYDLKHKIRFINASDFPVCGPREFLGFLCGIISQDYDIEGIFIDGLTYIVKQDADRLESLFEGFGLLAGKYGVSFYISVNGKAGEAPDFIKEYMV